MTSARHRKRRIMDMMASTVVVQFRWVSDDPESARIMQWLGRNSTRAINLLRAALKA